MPGLARKMRQGDSSLFSAIIISLVFLIAVSTIYSYIISLNNTVSRVSSSLSNLASSFSANLNFANNGSTIHVSSDRVLDVIGLFVYSSEGLLYSRVASDKPVASLAPGSNIDLSLIIPSTYLQQVLSGQVYLGLLASNGMLYTYRASSSGAGLGDLANILLNGDICSLLNDLVQRVACYINNRIYNDNVSQYLVYAYDAVMQGYTSIMRVGVYFAEAPIYFADSIANAIYSWSYSKYIGYTTWGGNYSIVVAGFYGSHGTCKCTNYNGFIFLRSGVTYTVVVRQQQAAGGRALGLYLMPPGTNTWIPMDSFWSSRLSSYASISSITMTAYSWTGNPSNYANSYRDFDRFFYSNPQSLWSGSISYIWFAGGVNLNPPADSDFPFAGAKPEYFATQTVFTITPHVPGLWGFAIDSDDAADVLVVVPGFSHADERSMLEFAARVVGIMAFNDYKGLVGGVFTSKILDGDAAQKILYYMVDNNMFDELIYVLTSIEGAYGGSMYPWDTVLYVRSISNYLDAPYVVVARNISGAIIRSGWGYSGPAIDRPRSFGAGSIVVLASTARYSQVISDPNNFKDSIGNVRPVYGGSNGYMPSISYNGNTYRGGGSGGGTGGKASCASIFGGGTSYGSPGYTTIFDSPVDAIDLLKMFFKYASDTWIRYALGKSISKATSIKAYGGSRGGDGAYRAYNWYEIYGGAGGGGGGLAILYATYSYRNSVSSPGGLGGYSGSTGGGGISCTGYEGYPGQPGLAVAYYRYGDAQADLKVSLPP